MGGGFGGLYTALYLQKYRHLKDSSITLIEPRERFLFTPLLYEGSSQAEFLKPPVITLVYGLGVGMVIVLLVVPAIMAMQSDFADRMRALRRAVTPRHGRMGLPLAVFATGAGIAAWFAATMGAFITSGTAAFALPIGDSGLTQAFVSFILGAALISAMSVSIAAFRSSTS